MFQRRNDYVIIGLLWLSLIHILCATARRCDSLNLLTEDNDYINLLDDDLSLEQKKRKIESFFDRKHFEACMYCDGFNDKYQRHTPAEQIKQLDDGDKQ